MTHKHQRSIFIFRQDLRIRDNSGLTKAISESKEIIPLFIFDTTILKRFPENNTTVWFILDAVKQLDKDLRSLWSYLLIQHGDPKDIIPSLAKQHNANAIYRNESYGYNAITRDASIQWRCRENNIACDISNDFLIVPIDSVEVRKVFTPFYKLRQKHIDAHPTTIQILPTPDKIYSPQIVTPVGADIEKELSYSPNTHRQVNLRRERFNSFSFSTYSETRNTPSIDGSSKLSPYMRFGLVSIREMYHKALQEDAQTYISELARREFWQHIYYHFPHTRTTEFQEKRRNIPWNNDPSHFQARQNGMTGYPIVDAGMRQLKTEWRMHNRVRMIVASFLTKDLLIDRRWWERHFANYLIDYDTNVNIGNWQWATSVGADPKPLRIFSPMLQSERFDPDCIYIKKWLPELQDYTPKQIHKPLENDLWYASPIVDHYEWSKKAKTVYMDHGRTTLS